MNLNVKSVVVLTAICLIVAVLLSVTNFYTAPVIEENKAQKIQDSLTVVMPEAAGFDEVAVPEGAPKTVKSIFKDKGGNGYVVVLETKSQYSSGNMGITVAVKDGTVSGISLTGYYESKDFGSDYPGTYVGADETLSGVDTVAGVTYSSTAFKNAIADAFTAVGSVN